MRSAVVVGPAGHEIHTDELGRVRAQFPWDREGRFDEDSSCWIRVSQGWAGGAFGMMALPRVGQEVLVGFIEGDPDQPVVVGRVYNAAARVPYALPEHQTVSTWKGASTPGSEGSNEIAFEDAKGSERIFLYAERDLEEQVKGHASLEVDHDRTKTIGGGEAIDNGMWGGRYPYGADPHDEALLKQGFAHHDASARTPRPICCARRRGTASPSARSRPAFGPRDAVASAFAEARIEVASSDDRARVIRAAGPLFAILDSRARADRPRAPARRRVRAPIALRRATGRAPRRGRAVPRADPP